MASLTGNTVASTYQSLIKIADNSSAGASLENLTDGLGNETAVWVASQAAAISGSFTVSGSTILSGSVQTAGVLTASGGVVGNLTGSVLGTASTASFVTTAQTASYVATALTASYVLNAVSASFVITAQTASYALTASFLSGSVATASLAQTASYVENAQTASYVVTAQTASYVNQLSQTLTVTGSILAAGGTLRVRESETDTAGGILLAPSDDYISIARQNNTAELTFALSASMALFPRPQVSTISSANGISLRVGTIGESVHVTGSLKVSGSIAMIPSASLVIPTTASAAPTVGSVYFDFTSNKLYAYNGTTWVTASLGA